MVSGIAFGLQPVPPRAAAVASRAVWRRSPRPMGACENPNLPVEMVEGRVKYRANEPAAHDTTKLPEPYPRIRSIRSSSTPQTAKDTSTRNTRAGFATWNGRYRLVFVRVDCWLGFAAMNDAKRPTPELYREAAERLRQMARECRLPDIRGDLLDLAARFERMAAYFEAQRPGAPRDPPES